MTKALANTLDYVIDKNKNKKRLEEITQENLNILKAKFIENKGWAENEAVIDEINGKIFFYSHSKPFFLHIKRI